MCLCTPTVCNIQSVLGSAGMGICVVAHPSKSCPSVSVEAKVDVTFRSESVTNNLGISSTLSEVNNTKREGTTLNDKSKENNEEHLNKDLGTEDIHPTLEDSLPKKEGESPNIAVFRKKDFTSLLSTYRSVCCHTTLCFFHISSFHPSLFTNEASSSSYTNLEVL